MCLVTSFSSKTFFLADSCSASENAVSSGYFFGQRQDCCNWCTYEILYSLYCTLYICFPFGLYFYTDRAPGRLKIILFRQCFEFRKWIYFIQADISMVHFSSSNLDSSSNASFFVPAILPASPHWLSSSRLVDKKHLRMVFVQYWDYTEPYHFRDSSSHVLKNAIVRTRLVDHDVIIAIAASCCGRRIAIVLRQKQLWIHGYIQGQLIGFISSSVPTILFGS